MKRRIFLCVLWMILTLTCAALAEDSITMSDMMGTEVTLTETEKNLGQVETSHVTFTVREALCDGYGVYVLVEVKAKEDGDFLMGENAWPSDPATMLVDNAMGNESIARYAKSKGYGRMRMESASVITEAENAGCAISSKWKSGVLYILLCTPGRGEDMTIQFTDTAFLNDGELDARKGERAKLSLTLTPRTALWSVSNQMEMDVAEYGVHLHRLTLTGTAVGTYYAIEYSMMDGRREPSVMLITDEEANGGVLYGVSARYEENGRITSIAGIAQSDGAPASAELLIQDVWGDAYDPGKRFTFALNE